MKPYFWIQFPGVFTTSLFGNLETDNSGSDQNAKLASRGSLQALCTRMVPYRCWGSEDRIQ